MDRSKPAYLARVLRAPDLLRASCPLDVTALYKLMNLDCKVLSSLQKEAKVMGQADPGPGIG